MNWQQANETYRQYHSDASGENRTIRIARHKVKQTLKETRIPSSEAGAFADCSGANFDIWGGFMPLIDHVGNINNVFQVVLARLLYCDVYFLG